MKSEIQTKIEALKKLRPKISKIFPGYIHHIRFPRYKNITEGTRIDFSFPVTALVGSNGSGKTSVMNALYGAPHRHSTGEYWFSTQVDPIIEGDGSPNRFIYGHYNEDFGAVVETRKARVQKVRRGRPDPNYWEPTKETTGDGMAVPALLPNKTISGRHKDRWNPVKRPVLYINFRRELSAFDKFFYFGRRPNLRRLKTRHDLIARDAGVLKRVIAAGDVSVRHYGDKVATENRHANPHELDAICRILGRTYTEAQFIRHYLFRGEQPGLSVIFRTAHGQYSEAFAGSGEVAVTSCVIQVLKAKEGTLVLLDEPEVSLHPSAQEKLLAFLIDVSLAKKLQIVFSTHSPFMVAPLPDDAIKVFLHDVTGKVSVIAQNSPYAAFRRLGARDGGSIVILTEDRLAQGVVRLALQNLDEAERERFRVDYVSGGADAVMKYRIPSFMNGSEPIFFLLDGDKKKVQGLVDPQTIPASDDATLPDIIKKQFGVEPILNPDGSEGKADQKQLTRLRRQYLQYAGEHVHYLPLSCPEAIVLNAQDGAQASQQLSSKDAKLGLKALAEKVLGSGISSDDIDNYGKTILAQRREQSAELTTLADLLTAIAAQVRPQ